MSNKVCCEVPTLPLCCDTESCQKILKSLHELGDGSCNYLSYCLAAAALPHCCWPPLELGLHLFALSLATPSTQPAVGARSPQPPRACGPEACSAAAQDGRPGARSSWEKLCFSWPGPKPRFASVSSTLRSLGRVNAQSEHAHPGAHTKCSFFVFVRVAFFFFSLPCWLRVS